MSGEEQELTKLFLAQKIEPSDFGHLDHLRVAYVMLQTNDFLDATTQYAQGIRNLAIRAGAAKKFNLTITIALMSLIAERMHTVPHNSFSEFIVENDDLLKRDILRQWYQHGRLQSDLAREIFVLPNVCKPHPTH